MRVLYLDTFSGISGNMLLGLLLDLGADAEYVLGELDKLDIGEYEINISKVEKQGISATYVDVQCQEFADHGHTHADGTHHHHDHNPVGSILHKLKHAISHTHAHGDHSHSHEHRNLAAIMQIINASSLSESIKCKAEEVFTAIAVAEAKVHGKSVEDVHFHEVGAVDTIIDIVGCLLAIESLKIDKIYTGHIYTGHGFVKCAHGLMPIPAPATAELLLGIPHSPGQVDKELVTPTGAALVKVLSAQFVSAAPMLTESTIGYGAGTWDLSIPNVVRGYLGEALDSVDDTSEVYILECNIDDMNPQFYEYIMNSLFKIGALDVWLTPIIMKKGRPGNTLSALLAKNLLDAAIIIILQESTTIGVRYYPVQRKIAQRQFKSVTLDSGKQVNIKQAYYNDVLVNSLPEFEDCKDIAIKDSLPLKSVWQEALSKGSED